MKMANIGIGVGAFANGLLGGMQIGREIKGARNEREIERIRKDGLKQSGQIREAEINSSIRRVPGAEGLPSQYQVGDRTFESQDEARRHAESSAPSQMDTFLQTAVPKIRETYLAQGNIEMANHWDQFAKSKQGERYIKDWSRGYMAMQTGDFKTASNVAGQLLSQVDPNLELVDAEDRRDDQGNIVGFNMKVRDKRSGNVSDVPMDQESFVNLYNANNPQAFAESIVGQQSAANKARVADAQDERKHRRTLERDAFQHEGKVELETIKGQIKDAGERRKFDQKMNALRQAGYSDEFINGAMPSILGIEASGPYRKGPSPEEVSRMLYQERIKDKYGFGSLSPEQQKAVIDQDMKTIQDSARIYGRSAPEDEGSSAGRGSPAQGGLPIHTFNN